MIARPEPHHAVVLALLVLSCPATPAQPTEQRATPSTEQSSTSGAPARSDAPEFVLAPNTGDVIDIVKSEQTRAAADKRTLLVYVGASWCEPCRYFHAAIDDGTLDDDLAGVRLLEFDLDRDKDRLVAAGYRSRLIPLFVAPGPDGRAGPRRTEGGVKGPAAVENLRERLVALVNAARADQTLERRSGSGTGASHPCCKTLPLESRR